MNPQCPRTHGSGGIHQSHLDVLCVSEFNLPELKINPETSEEAKIGQLIADNLVEDGATLQMGQWRNFSLVTHWLITCMGPAC